MLKLALASLYTAIVVVCLCVIEGVAWEIPFQEMSVRTEKNQSSDKEVFDGGVQFGADFSNFCLFLSMQEIIAMQPCHSSHILAQTY